jgi:hypothetical protein
MEKVQEVRTQLYDAKNYTNNVDAYELRPEEKHPSGKPYPFVVLILERERG